MSALSLSRSLSLPVTIGSAFSHFSYSPLLYSLPPSQSAIPHRLGLVEAKVKFIDLSLSLSLPHSARASHSEHASFGPIELDSSEHTITGSFGVVVPPLPSGEGEK